MLYRLSLRDCEAPHMQGSHDINAPPTARRSTYCLKRKALGKLPDPVVPNNDRFLSWRVVEVLDGRVEQPRVRSVPSLSL